MAKLIVKKTERLRGVVEAPSSKAYTHRAVIAASLSNGRSVITNPLKCHDTDATVKACSMLGAKIKRKNSSLIIEGFSKPKAPENVINCRGSGSTIRFLTPVCALADGASVLTGDRSLRKRPMRPLLDALNQLGAKCFSARSDGKPPIIVLGGGIEGGKASLAGNVSSQFVSGLLFATPRAKENTIIGINTPLESKPYVEMTLDVLKRHGVEIEHSQNYDFFAISSEQEFKSTRHIIEGDYSSAAFLLAAASITDSKVKVIGLKKQTLQSDKAILDVLKEMDVSISLKNNSVEVYGSGNSLKPIDVDLMDSPDLFPVCAALACFADGKSIIRGIKRLRYKESDRLSALASEFRKMGSMMTVSDNFVAIEGKKKLRGAQLFSHKDHRIAMACVITALKAEGETVIHGIECVRKSYPNFVGDLKFLGGKIVGW